MSKSFEECYKTELLNELPDLWSRIEAGINAENVQQRSEIPLAAKEETAKEVKAEKKEAVIRSYPKKKNRFWNYAIPVMAACVLGVIVLPVGFLVLGGGDMSMEMPAMESAQADCDMADKEYAPEENRQDIVGEAAEEYVYAYDADMNNEASSSIKELLIEVVYAKEDMVTFRILDENAQEIAEEYGLMQEAESYMCLCETMEEVALQEQKRYYAYLREDGDEIYLGVLMEYSE